MTGQEFRLLIENSGMDIKDVIHKSGIPKATLYTIYKKERVEPYYIKKLESIGISIKSTEKSNESDELKQIITDRENQIAVLKDHIETLKKLNAELEQNKEGVKEVKLEIIKNRDLILKRIDVRLDKSKK